MNSDIAKKKTDEGEIDGDEQPIDLQVKNKRNTKNRGNENTSRSRKIPLGNLPDITTTTDKKTRRDRPTATYPIKISKRERNNNCQRRSIDHRVTERERARKTAREIRKYKSQRPNTRTQE